jgi:peptide chain release factor
VIKCQDTRSQEQNRKIARQRLHEKLDFIENGENSKLAMRIEKMKKRKADRKRKARRKLDALQARTEGSNEPSPDDERVKA